MARFGKIENLVILALSKNFEKLKFFQIWTIVAPIDAEKRSEHEKHGHKALGATGPELERDNSACPPVLKHF
ncbi:MAG: hypothetical protein GY820_17865 [Gammaproteobacteria bacterium]|nr:hypothetical protein [Gammaproteobacteria bacterium]